MNAKSVVMLAAHAVAVTFFTGCMNMMPTNATSMRSFEDPPVRETVDAFSEEKMAGKWESQGKTDTFLDGKRVMVQDLKIELELNKDGTCTSVETKTVAESKVAGMGTRCGQKSIFSGEGLWKYKNGILTMDLNGEYKNGMAHRNRKTKVEYTVKWHSGDEFSLWANDEQFKANTRDIGLGWDSRTVEPNGVETCVRKGSFLTGEQKSVSYSSPFTRVENAKK